MNHIWVWLVAGFLPYTIKRQQGKEEQTLHARALFWSLTIQWQDGQRSWIVSIPLIKHLPKQFPRSRVGMFVRRWKGSSAAACKDVIVALLLTRCLWHSGCFFLVYQARQRTFTTSSPLLRMKKRHEATNGMTTVKQEPFEICGYFRWWWRSFLLSLNLCPSFH